MDKHIYHDGETWIVATSAEEAAKLASQDGEEYSLANGYDPFEQEPDDKILKIDDENEREVIAKTCGEWAKQSNLGYLCSVNY